VRERAKAWKALRMTATERDAKLAVLHHELRVAEARLERARRVLEAEGEPMFGRVNFDPGIWLLPQPALEELAA